MIEKWRDTAFGSDFGGDFLDLIERISDDKLSMDLIYKNTDVKKYLDNPNLLQERTDNNVKFTNTEYEQYIHFEDLIIGLSVIIVEAELNNEIDLTKAYGSKTVTFTFQKNEVKPICSALQVIYNNPDDYVLFEMCMEEERKETLNDIKEIVVAFEKIVN
ncbi:hypothetical protein ATO12_16025 [Aquimarina atlantica]|uniref:Uncharacterized protein n=1 Tax=Aquimarina atlantica TaxID=1317122 RepID=A0A023BTV7_9FLAO|nr:imm68 putative immunity domain-containing protein [Aquimarina atlantica]EZH73447.1 hypothetical protein ATO12_16025 [Aquimarina atlantica]